MLSLQRHVGSLVFRFCQIRLHILSFAKSVFCLIVKTLQIDQSIFMIPRVVWTCTLRTFAIPGTFEHRWNLSCSYVAQRRVQKPFSRYVVFEFLSFLTTQLGLVCGMHSKCSFRHTCWVVTPTDELGARCRTHRRLAHVTFVCSTEPKMPPAMSKCCSTDLPSCPSKNLPCKRNVFCVLFSFVQFLILF